MKYFRFVSALLLSASLTAAVQFDTNSFQAPFDVYSGSGKRLVEGWKFGGDASVKENFVRLTPDRQSKRGWMMNAETIGAKEFTIYLRFRISGQGKTLFGDGFGVWVTRKPKPRFEPGFVMGSTGEFVGFGILFDTFRNIEANHVHRDVSLVVGNGEPIALDSERPGCDSKYRYYENRQDFVPGETESRAKITLKDGRVTVELDQYGDDKWAHCFTSELNKDVKLPRFWESDARFSLSASTGALADNHDILEFTVTSPENHKKMMELKDSDDEPQVIVDVHPEIKAEEVGEHVNDLSYEVKDVQDKLKVVHHSVEHQMETFKSHIENMIKKLQEQEEADEARIEELEKRQKASMEASLNKRVGDLEKKLTNNIETRLNKLEMKVKRGITTVESQSGAWKIPVVVVVILMVVAFFFNTRSIKKLQSRDKIF